jgi:hypothetical protein
MKVDFLTETQTTLQTNLPTYQGFKTKISDFLTDITAAGGGTTTDTTTGAAATMKSLVNVATGSETADNPVCASGNLSSSSNSVPEPTAIGLALLGSLPALCGRRRRRS